MDIRDQIDCTVVRRYLSLAANGKAEYVGFDADTHCLSFLSRKVGSKVKNS